MLLIDKGVSNLEYIRKDLWFLWFCVVVHRAMVPSLIDIIILFFVRLVLVRLRTLGD
jgi:hypothetical protein